MVDFHKGFEGFEKLGGYKPKKKDGVLFSEGAGESFSLEHVPSYEDAKAFYNELLFFVKRQFDLVAEGKDKQVEFGEIVTYAEKTCDIIAAEKKPNIFIRLFFENDDFRSNYIYNHSVNVCFMCLRLALELNFSRKRMIELAIGSLFHDIGMMKVPSGIWNKPGALSDAEYRQVQEHPLLGEGLFTNIDNIGEVVPLVIGQHQEKVDGSGYPGRLTIDNIHYLSRLISIVDCYETRTHTRFWKTKGLPDRTIQELLDHETGKYDPHFMKAMLRVVSIYPVGTYVRISSGEVCKVEEINKETPMRPIVSLFMDNAKKSIKNNRVLDLSKQLLVHVDRCVDPAEI